MFCLDVQVNFMTPTVKLYETARFGDNIRHLAFYDKIIEKYRQLLPPPINLPNMSNDFKERDKIYKKISPEEKKQIQIEMMDFISKIVCKSLLYFFLESGVCTSFIWKDEKEITVIYAVYPSAETPPMSPR